MQLGILWNGIPMGNRFWGNDIDGELKDTMEER